MSTTSGPARRARKAARVLGTCTGCGKPVFGRRAVTEEQARHIKASAIRVPGEGVRHNKSGCRKPSPYVGGARIERG